MTYQVLARKWRPKTFADLVGQEHVVKALQNALDKGRLHHAYLLTGTRGVGKTTIARILAKSLNCETPSHGEPCGECPSCTAIDQGRFVDLLEIDAASNTGIDNIREVLENAQYAPTAGKYKVYIIDEVHMLSKSAFNAMLKTLEEPPGHVKFILATTDPHKVPITVLSRCLQFVLRNMTPAQVSGHLARVLDSEQIAYDQASLALIGRAANGSMRDALSLLDQAIAMGSGSVAEADVRQMIGAADRRYLYTLLNALAARDGAAMIAEARQMAANAVGFDGALHDLAALLQQIALLQTVPQAADSSDPEHAALSALAQQFSGEQIQLYYQCLLHGRRDLPLAPDEYAGFVMTLLRMLAFAPFAAEAVPAGSRIEGVAAAPVVPPAPVRQPESPKQPESPENRFQAAAEPSASDAAKTAGQPENGFQAALDADTAANKVPASHITESDNNTPVGRMLESDKTAAKQPENSEAAGQRPNLQAADAAAPEQPVPPEAQPESTEEAPVQRTTEQPAAAVGRILESDNTNTATKQPESIEETPVQTAAKQPESAEPPVQAAGDDDDTPPWADDSAAAPEPAQTAAPTKQPERPKQPENGFQAAPSADSASGSETDGVGRILESDNTAAEQPETAAAPKRKSRSKKAAAESETQRQPENETALSDTAAPSETGSAGTKSRRSTAAGRAPSENGANPPEQPDAAGSLKAKKTPSKKNAAASTPMPAFAAENWPLIAERISPRVAAAQMALQHTAWRSFDEAVGQLTLALVRENARSTSSPEYFRRIADALSEAYGRPVSLHIENWQEGDGETPSMYRTRKAKENRELAKDLMEQDKAVQDIQKLFDARWIEASIELAGEDAAADTQAA